MAMPRGAGFQPVLGATEPFFRQVLGGALLGSLTEASEQNGVWTLQAGIFPRKHG
jgi:hypothetical protein